MPVEELSPGIYGWKGGEGVMLRTAGGAGGGGESRIAELKNEIKDAEGAGTKVWLGLRACTEDEDQLDAAGIELVVTVGSAPTPLPGGVPVQKVALGDMVKEPLLGHVLKPLDKIDATLADGGSVLVTSEDGEGEEGATAIVVAWLLARRKVPWADVQALVSSERPSAALNANYEKQLRVWTTWKEFPGLPGWM